jgi:hypothetical protein
VAAALPVNWALGGGNALARHLRSGSLALSLTDGGAAVNTTVSNAFYFGATHGALMLAAFVLLMPGAALSARHKYLFADKQVGCLVAVVVAVLS